MEELELVSRNVKKPEAFNHLNVDPEMYWHRVKNISHEGKTKCTLWYEKMMHQKYMRYFASRLKGVSCMDISPEFTVYHLMGFLLVVFPNFNDT